MDLDKGIWLLPTRRRLGKLRKVFQGMNEIGVASRGLILVNRDEWAELQSEYEAIRAPVGWSYHPVDAECMGEAIRKTWALYKDLDWVGIMGDDAIPCSAGWDLVMVRALTGWNFVSANDGWQAPNRMGQCVAWSGDLIRAVGYLFPKGFRHLYQDDVWESLGRATNCWLPKMDAFVRHEHYMKLGTPEDETTKHVNANYEHDGAAFRQWRETEMETASTAIRQLMERAGLRILQPDFKGINLMIATPSIRADYDDIYISSLFATMQFLGQNGVTCQWAEEKHNADIALARNKIAFTFLRSPCTHLLQIDADMGWHVDAIARLIAAKKDFVGVAGPKKFYPLKFAANWSDDNGNPLPVVWDTSTGTVEVGEIGGAFVMTTKKVFNDIIAANPDLAYEGAFGALEYGIFDPIIRRHRRYSEDFALCRRWRDLGGQVFCCPDVALSHKGQHVFHGKMSDSWAEEEAARKKHAEKVAAE